tara:strand:+ start:136 stop:711 length:576 start_codon:yes stop_codon:yes gene_type:complete
MDFTLIAIVSYLFGSIPFGFILTKSFLKIDIRNVGSGNIGATNALRTGNKLIAYSTLFLDILKAIIPVLYVKFYYQDLLYISALTAFLGHIFPIWLKFKGGKGVATYLGILISINIIFGVMFGIAWILTYVFTKYSSLASILGSLVIPIYVFYMNLENAIFYFIIFILIFYTHRENIKRLINKEENKTKIY